MVKMISIGSSLLLLLLAASTPAPAQEESQQSDPQQSRAGQEQQSGQDEDARDGAEGPRIYPNAAVSLIGMGVPVVDLRSDEQVEETGLLADATHIPASEIDAIVDFIGDDVDRAIVVYSGSGRDASSAIEQLRQRGYHGMVNAGGYEDLREALEGDDE